MAGGVRVVVPVVVLPLTVSAQPSGTCCFVPVSLTTSLLMGPIRLLSSIVLAPLIPQEFSVTLIWTPLLKFLWLIQTRE